MLLLAMDTSTPAVTVAVHDGVSLLVESTAVDARRQGELLAPAIQTVLDDAGVHASDLTDIAVGVGPGPFTGLRVGVVTARIMAATLGVAVHGICSLDVVAAAVTADVPFLVATDARRREVYWAAYDGPRQRASEPAVATAASIDESLRSRPVAGQGPSLYPDAFPHAIAPDLPSAGTMARLVAARLGAGGEGLLDAQPLYLRRPDAESPRREKSVLS